MATRITLALTGLALAVTTFLPWRQNDLGGVKINVTEIFGPVRALPSYVASHRDPQSLWEHRPLVAATLVLGALGISGAGAWSSHRWRLLAAGGLILAGAGALLGLPSGSTRAYDHVQHTAAVYAAYPQEHRYGATLALVLVGAAALLVGLRWLRQRS